MPEYVEHQFTQVQKMSSEERTEEIESFICETQDGTRVTVVVYQEYLISRSQTNHEGTRHDGKLKYETFDRRPLDPIDSETFKILDTDQIIRKVD